MKIGFIGQGYVGKNYADNLESRGFDVVRYSKEEAYKNNKEQIALCDIVFIAVPTPTTVKGFDDSVIRAVLPLVKKNTTVVIKSTVALGVTEKLATDFPDYFLMHSPEFLSERTAQYDVEHPHAQIVGIPKQTPEFTLRAQQVLEVLPDAPFKKICSSLEAEFMKYSRNIHGFYEIIFYNLFYDLSQALGVDYEVIKEYIKSDPLHVYRYASPVHDSGHTLGKFGRGAGGHCFLKDFKAFKNIVEEKLHDQHYGTLLASLEQKNLELLRSTKKDLDYVREVYGDEASL